MDSNVRASRTLMKRLESESPAFMGRSLPPTVAWNKGKRQKMSAGLLRATLALLILDIFGVLEATTISCRNEEDEPVDWFVFYKPPVIKNGHKLDGLEYLYLDPTTRGWKKSKQLISSTSGVMGSTLQQLYRAYFYKENNTAYVIYNDGVPKAKIYYGKFGHTKGLLVWNTVQGFWMIHSIPRFPPVPEEGYSYPKTGKKYGQSGICVTFKYSQYEDIDFQLLISNPNIYSCFIPPIFYQELDHIPDLCARSSPRTRWVPKRRLSILQSAEGEEFLHFAKSNSYREDIFTDWMAPYLRTHLLAETWLRRKQRLPSDCSHEFHVYNIRTVKLSTKFHFRNSQDHSKWCVSHESSGNQWTCIGDLNRSPYQMLRSGGYICTQNQDIYWAFRELVQYYEECLHFMNEQIQQW